jgi:hypothetical protein
MDDSTKAPRVTHAERLTSVFGYWPSFHDAEVVEVVLRRMDADGWPSLTALIHVFEMTSEVSATGHYVCRHHVLATLRFAGITRFDAEQFNHQNALSGLVIEDVPAPDEFSGTIRVALPAAYGFDCAFTCREVEVTAVEPGIPPGSVYARPAPG